MFSHITVDSIFHIQILHRHLGLENKTENWRPLLYLTYSGVCSDGEVLFQDEKNFDKSMSSLEEEGGLVPDRPSRNERAMHRANGK